MALSSFLSDGGDGRAAARSICAAARHFGHLCAPEWLWRCTSFLRFEKVHRQVSLSHTLFPASLPLLSPPLPLSPSLSLSLLSSLSLSPFVPSTLS